MLCISGDRLKHSLEVARYLKWLAEEAGWSKEKCEEMFVLGYLHDVGYEFSERQDEHAYVGGQMLKKQGYKYWQEVANHGIVNCEYFSEELKMLNIADMTINSSGQKVGVESRLNDIACRYGETSKQYLDAQELAIKIGLSNNAVKPLASAMGI